MGPKTVDRGRGGARLPARTLVAIGVIAGALVPAVVALVLFASVVLHRPLLAGAVREGSGVSSAKLTVLWAVALVAIAAVQAAGAVLGAGSITSAGGMAARTGFALAVEAVLLAATAAYLRAPSRRLG